MRRRMSALLAGVLVGVLWFSAASADPIFAPHPVDLSAKLFARCFGESQNANVVASFSDIAEHFTPVVSDVTPHVVHVPEPLDLVLPNPRVSLADPSFAVPTPRAAAQSAPTPSIAELAARLTVPSVGYYESASPIPTDAPATQRFDLAGFVASPVQTEVSGTRASVKVPIQVGHLSFAPHAEAQATSAPQPALGDATLGAGTTFNIRAGKRSLGLDVSSELEHTTLAAPEYSATGNAAPLQSDLAGGNLPVFVPAYADVSTKTLSTGVSVPVTRALTASVQYDTQHLLGTYGLPGASNLDENNTIYGAQLTFQLPKSASAISLAMRQYRYQDNLLPVNALMTTNANVNFTIKF